MSIKSLDTLRLGDIMMKRYESEMSRNDPDLIKKLQERVVDLRKESERHRQKYIQSRDELILAERLIRQMAGNPQPEKLNRNGQPQKRRGRKSACAEKCLEILRQEQKQMSVAALNNRLTQLGSPPGSGTVSWTLRRLVEEGKVKKIKYGVFEYAGKSTEVAK